MRSRLHWLLLVLAALALAVLLWPTVALAQNGDGDVITPQTDLAMWSLLVGAALPALVAFVQRSTWSKRTRAIVGLVSSVVAGGVTTWLTEGDALWEQGMAHAILLTAIAAWGSYTALWKPTGAAAAIEAKTNSSPSPPQG
jgi:peptidoglycan/LPS O-acetylase OafA/YrhL